MRVTPYDQAHKDEWDSFVRRSKNGTFLFLRDYMDYHIDRFPNASLMVQDDKDRLVALLPANRDGTTLVSHGGLTFGGFITDEAMTVPMMLETFDATRAHLRDAGFENWIYKAVPHIYHRFPAEEDNYALFRNGAHLFRRDVTITARPSSGVAIQERRKRSIKKAIRAGIRCELSNDYAAYWPILEDTLQRQHGVRPVHTLEEIQRLHERFPDNIRLFAALLDDRMLAGVVVYESACVAHAQYIANSERGQSCGALDALFSDLLTTQFKDKRYFDFGVCTEEQGHHLNVGLVEFKQGFGGRAIGHDFYSIDLTS